MKKGKNYSDKETQQEAEAMGDQFNNPGYYAYGSGGDLTHGKETYTAIPRGDSRLRDVTYHRNGIGGTGYFSVRYDWNDNGHLRRMVATIERNEADDGFDETSCRVMDTDNPHLSWRGDAEAPKIIHRIRTTPREHIYGVKKRGTTYLPHQYDKNGKYRPLREQEMSYVKRVDSKPKVLGSYSNKAGARRTKQQPCKGPGCGWHGERKRHSMAAMKGHRNRRP